MAQNRKRHALLSQGLQKIDLDFGNKFHAASGGDLDAIRRQGRVVADGGQRRHINHRHGCARVERQAQNIWPEGPSSSARTRTRPLSALKGKLTERWQYLPASGL